MCENSAVKWSDYELAKRQQESECRRKISEELAKHVDLYRKNGFPDLYIQGMERARLLMLFNKSPEDEEKNFPDQQSLF